MDTHTDISFILGKLKTMNCLFETKVKFDKCTARRTHLVRARHRMLIDSDSPGLQGTDGVNLCDAHNGSEGL